MMRWLVAIVAAALGIAAGYVMFINPHQVNIYLAPGRARTWPLGAALLVAFGGGAGVVGALAGLRAGARGWRSWRTTRRQRREARHAALTARAQHLVWSGDYRQARTELLRAEGGVPADAARLVLLAETYLHEDDPVAARKLLDEGIHKVGLEPRLLDLAAEAAERSGDLRAAADALERARTAQPDSPRLARRVRDLYATSGRWSEALAVQGEIVLRVRDPATLARENEILRGLRYQAALAESEPRVAARALVGLAREDPTFVPAWVSAGDVLLREGRRFAARRVWERGARRQPAAVLLERLERLDLSEGNPERTTRRYRRLQRRHPESPALTLMLVRHLLAQEKIEEATETLNLLPAAVATHPLVHVLWGDVHRRHGNHSLAAETYARVFGTDLGILAPFECATCRRPADAWTGYCDECRRWGTYRARAERTEAASANPRS
jgi:tetratricopeptide (TPR) repeat protein